MNDSQHWQIILDIVTVCRRMWQKGWVANHDGNATAKVELNGHPERAERVEGSPSQPFILATPTAVSKADIIPEIILTLDMEGKKIAGPGKPFSEINLHLAAYNARPKILAVVHAHPPYATARGACNLPLNKSFIPESIVSLGNVIPVVPYSMPGSKEGADALASALLESNAAMIEGNGVLAVGVDVMQAYLRLELVEHLAYMDFIAKQTGAAFEIPAEDIAKLLEKCAAAGLGPKMTACHPRESGDLVNTLDSRWSLPPNGLIGGGNDQSADHDQLRKIIAEEIKTILGN